MGPFPFIEGANEARRRQLRPRPSHRRTPARRCRQANHRRAIATIQISADMALAANVPPGIGEATCHACVSPSPVSDAAKATGAKWDRSSNNSAPATPPPTPSAQAAMLHVGALSSQSMTSGFIWAR